MRVIRAVVDAQRDFFDKGPEFLRPLPMILVADQLGIHVATVSRAVSEKWIQTPRGVFLLRRFFSGGTQSAEGEDMSWDAVKEKLKAIIGDEDKDAPLNDDDIVLKLKDQGIDLARRNRCEISKDSKISPLPGNAGSSEFEFCKRVASVMQHVWHGRLAHVFLQVRKPRARRPRYKC